MFEFERDDFTEHDQFKLGAMLETSGVLPGEYQAAGDTAIAVSKGDLILIEATGTIQGEVTPGQPAMQVTPEGVFGWLGGQIYPLVNRTPLAMFGRIGKSEFLIGSGTVLLAPESGKLELVLNSCNGCDVQGTFDVQVHTRPRPEITLAEQPLLTDDSVRESRALDVAPASGWTSVGMTVERGEKITVDASGTVTVAGTPALDMSPNGDESSLGGVFHLIPAAASYRLFVRIGSRIISLGTSSAFLAPTSGQLEVAINARSADTAAGSFHVEVHRGVRPARGIDGLSTGDLDKRQTVTVDLDDRFVASGITVERGAPVVIAASGAVSGPRVDVFQANGEVTPYGTVALAGLVYELPSRPQLALFGRVGDQVFYTGGSNVILAPASGPLELAINTIRCYECTNCENMCGQDPDCMPPPIDCVDCTMHCGTFSGAFQVTVATP